MTVSADNDTSLSLSVVIPVYTAAATVGPLVDDVVREVGRLGCTYEVILVNDGSTDGSDAALDKAATGRPQVKVIHFAANCGQTIAIRAGLEAASGDRIVMLDGDRQNDPADIGPLLARLDEGFICVSGWRRDRQDTGLRRLCSQAANGLIRWIAGSPVHDLGCTLKAYRRDALDPAELFGEMHRFLAILAASRGKVAEMVVRHHPRTAGVSKYGLGRIPRVVADILLLRLLLKYPTRPSHLFATFGQYLAVAAIVLFLLGLVEPGFCIRILPAVVTLVGATIVLSVGLCCELVVRARYLTSGHRPYRVARSVNFNQA